MKMKNLNDANPLPGILEDEVWELLRKKNFITDDLLRDFYIRLEYNKWREAGIEVLQCLMIIQKEHNELTLNEIKKICFDDCETQV